MNITIDILTELKAFRSWFKGSTEFNIIVQEKSVTFVSKKGFLTSITTLPADVSADIDLPVAFSFMSTLFMSLNVNPKGRDHLSINISLSNVIVSINDRVISVIFTKSSDRMVDFGKDADKVSKISIKELLWLLSVSRLYPNDTIQIRDDIAYMDTEDGIYFVNLKALSDKTFSFIPALLNRSKPNTEVFISDVLEVREKYFRKISKLFKTEVSVYETICFAKKQSAKVKLTLSLASHKLDIKSLRTATFKTSIIDKNLIIQTKDNEVLSLKYDILDKDIATSDFENMTIFSDLANSISILGYPVHQLISNEKSVILHMTPYTNIIRYNDTGFLILKG